MRTFTSSPTSLTQERARERARDADGSVREVRLVGTNETYCVSSSVSVLHTLMVAPNATRPAPCTLAGSMTSARASLSSISLMRPSE
jgi:hypothetical protein